MKLETAPALTLRAIPEGVDGIRETLRLMRDLTRAGKKTGPVFFAARDATAAVPQKDWRGEAAALHDWVRDFIRYAGDIRGVEVLQTPERTLDMGAGDCASKSVLLAAMLESLNHPTRFVAVAPAARPGHYSHVLVETLLGTRWVPSDTTEPVPFGWYPPGVDRRRLVVTN